VFPLEHTFVNGLRLPHHPTGPPVIPRTLAGDIIFSALGAPGPPCGPATSTGIRVRGRITVEGAELMRVLTIALAVLVASLTGSSLFAQEGHPLKGSWLGTWGPAKTHSNDIVLVLDWDGKNITGMVNPGTDDAPIKNATLNPDGWIVRFETDIKDKSGVLNYVIEGKIENLSFHNRTIVGTWKNQRESGALKISRQ
jgi:hypothetical protein